MKVTSPQGVKSTSPEIYKLVTHPESKERDLISGLHSTKMKQTEVDKDDKKHDY